MLPTRHDDDDDICTIKMYLELNNGKESDSMGKN